MAILFPYWHKPTLEVGAILVHSQDELDALQAAGWPHGAAEPEMTKGEIVAALKAKGAKVDLSHSKAALAAQLAAL